jgi:methyl-accepting chemotaxis protein
LERDNAVQIEEKFEDLRIKSQQGLNQVEEVYHSLKRHRIFIEELSDLGTRLNQAASTLQPMIVNADDLLNLNEEIHLKAKEMASKLQDEVQYLKELAELNQAECTFLVKNLLNNHSFLEAAWVNDSKGRFLISIPPAGIANAKVRDWFVSSIEGKNYVTAPYISAITGRPCVTVSVPVYDKKGIIQGVLGVDLQC